MNREFRIGTPGIPTFGAQLIVPAMQTATRKFEVLRPLQAATRLKLFWRRNMRSMALRLRRRNCE
jgi:hypothetical protein